jgi:hypothetical protein
MNWKDLSLQSLLEVRNNIQTWNLDHDSEVLLYAFIYVMIKCLISAPDYDFKKVWLAFNADMGISKHGFPVTDQIDFQNGQIFVNPTNDMALVLKIQQRSRFCSAKATSRNRKTKPLPAVILDKDVSTVTPEMMLQRFVDDLWDNFPSPAVYLKKSLPRPSPFFTAEVLEEYVTSYTIIHSKISWEKRFRWYFPAAGDSMEHFQKQGFVSLEYISFYLKWLPLSSQEDRDNLFKLFMQLELLPNSSPKDRLWRSTKDKKKNKTAVQFVLRHTEDEDDQGKETSTDQEEEKNWMCPVCSRTFKLLKNGRLGKRINDHIANCGE